MNYIKTSTTHCPDCKQTPRYDYKQNAIKCACKEKSWSRKKPVYGTNEIQALFESKRFMQLKDAAGDLYYIGPGNQLIHLYEDGTWEGAIVPEGTAIEDYLNSLKPEEESVFF